LNIFRRRLGIRDSADPILYLLIVDMSSSNITEGGLRWPMNVQPRKPERRKWVRKDRLTVDREYIFKNLSGELREGGLTSRKENVRGKSRGMRTQWVGWEIFFELGF
jgi:hypothetical protein